MLLRSAAAGATATGTVIPSGRDTPRPTRHAGRDYTWQEYEREGHTQPSVRPPDPALNIRYSCNSLGYRCPELDRRRELNVCSVGCSETFGVGVPVAHRFSTELCRMIQDRTGRGVQDFNLAQGGKSNDWIARCVLENLEALRPDLLVVCYTYLHRREYTDITGLVIDFLPGVPLKEIPPQMRDAWARLLYLGSPYEDALNLYRNHALVVAHAARCGVPLLVAYLDDTVAELPPFLGAVGPFQRLDVASDGTHRFLRSHRRLAEQLLERCPW